MAKKQRHPGITTKRLNNKRFRKTEDAIVEAFFKCDSYASVEQIARRAGIYRSTVYYHHSAKNGIVLDYERYILYSYNKVIGRMLRAKQSHLSDIYFRTLLFIIANRHIFLLLAEAHDTRVIHEMIDHLRGKIERSARLPKNSEKIFRVYRSEVVAILEKWGEDGYPESEMTQVLDDIMYLTRTIRTRLKPLLD